MHNLTEQVLVEFREAARWRGLPAHDTRPSVDTTQDVWASFRRAMRDQGPRRIVGVR